MAKKIKKALKFKFRKSIKHKICHPDPEKSFFPKVGIISVGVHGDRNIPNWDKSPYCLNNPPCVNRVNFKYQKGGRHPKGAKSPKKWLKVPKKIQKAPTLKLVIENFLGFKNSIK